MKKKLLIFDYWSHFAVKDSETNAMLLRVAHMWMDQWLIWCTGKFIPFHKFHMLSMLHSTKMESTLFVSSKFTFSEYLWCLNFPPEITKQVEKSNPVFESFRSKFVNTISVQEFFKFISLISFKNSQNFEIFFKSKQIHQLMSC